MDSQTSGIVGAVVGWGLAQVAFFYQRRVSIRGDVSKAAYFLVILLKEIEIIVSIKENKLFHGVIKDEVVDRARDGLIGKADFQKEVASACEKIAIVDIQVACDIRKSCIIIDQIVKSKLKNIRKSRPDVANISENMYINGLRHELYSVERSTFYVLLACDIKYFVKFCRRIGWEKASQHILKRKNPFKMDVEELGSVLSSVVEMVDDMDLEK